MAPLQHTKNIKVSTTWWERVVVQRSAFAVDEQVESATLRSPFLTATSHDNDLAMLFREEVQLGALLGSGTYSDVYEVSGLDLLDTRGDAHEEVEDLMNVKAREALQADVAVSSRSNGGAKYAIKHLQRGIVKDTKKFEAAACDLIMEAKFLSQLSHKNILPLRGVALGGAATYARTGLYDSFFIIVDRIKETLKDRLYRWREERIASISNYENGILAKIEIALQVASALAYLHERRLVFRDLKPANLGITAGNTIQLFDFGFCRELPPETTMSSTYLGQLEFEVEPLANEHALTKQKYADRLYGMSGKGTLMVGCSSEVLQ